MYLDIPSVLAILATFEGYLSVNETVYFFKAFKIVIFWKPSKKIQKANTKETRLHFEWAHQQ